MLQNEPLELKKTRRYGRQRTRGYSVFDFWKVTFVVSALMREEFYSGLAKQHTAITFLLDHLWLMFRGSRGWRARKDLIATIYRSATVNPSISILFFSRKGGCFIFDFHVIISEKDKYFRHLRDSRGFESTIFSHFQNKSGNILKFFWNFQKIIYSRNFT